MICYANDDSLMSYLICLYVYYNGNNLEQFGITRGASDDELNNSGLRQPEDIDPKYVRQELIDAAIKQKENEVRANEYYNTYRASIQNAQRESYELQKKGLVSGTIFEDTPDSVVDTYEDNDAVFGSVMNAFNSLNGF